MGIHLLNTFIQSIYNNGSRIINLSELSDKKIVIDTSIYLYRFKALGGLLENMYLMCSIMRFYNIHPLFIFDGKSDSNKDLTKQKRKVEKEKAKKEYEKLKKDLRTVNEEEKEVIEEKMNVLRRRFISIKKEDIENVKQLFEQYGISYLNAKGEADELCAALVINGNAYACLSEDTDMFAYGCPRILKYISLMKHTVVMYPMNKMLQNIKVDFSNFQKMCILSGTDYNFTKRNIFSYYSLYKRYINSKSSLDFLDWLSFKKYISVQTFNDVKDIYSLYNKDHKVILSNIKYLIIKNKKINFKGLQSVLKKENFIFSY